ncbi:MAG: hypothetical protein KC547_18010 [Anaerolineae bacterium]|nr:hypothetical protein [Anaerolineae bacterium]MCA9909163.1 hypothetical protein [Anaerolineae bacterium]
MKPWLWRLLLLLPILALVGWFIIEQAPQWNTPSPPWERYPDLAALPGGCEAANILRVYAAERVNEAPQTAVDAAQAQQLSDALLQAQYPEQEYTFVLPPELLRGKFGAGNTAWFSLVNFSRATDSLAQGATVLIDANSGTSIAVTHVIGIDTDSTTCGEFAPQPRGLRARLRPFLPLILVAGYVVLVGAGAVALGLRKQRHKSTV